MARLNLGETKQTACFLSVTIYSWWRYCARGRGYYMGLMRLGVKVSIGWLRATVNVLLGTAVLFDYDRLLPGLTVRGFSVAFFASTASAIITRLLSLYPKRINKGTAINRQRPIP